MSTNSSMSRVTISLNLTGQANTVRGLQEATTALDDLGKVVADTSATISASLADTEAAFAASADGAKAMATSVEEAFPWLADYMKGFADTVKTATASIDALRTSVASLDASMRVTVPSASKSLTSGLGSAKSSADGLLKSLTDIKVLLAGGFAYSSLKALTNYSSARVRLQTLGGLSARQAASFSGVANKIASSTGSSPTDVLSAMYNPVSEGFSKSASAQIVTDAARVAKMGGAALSGQSGTSYTLSTLLQNLYGGEKGGPTANQIASTYGLMMATVGAGDMDVNGLLAANQTGIWNTASAYGMLPGTTASYLAFMSSQGVNPAEAGTRGRMAISMLAAPSGKGQKIEAALGIAPTEMLQLMHGPNGLGAATADLIAHMKAKGLNADQRAVTLSEIFGGARTDASILAMVQHGSLLAQFNQRIGALSNPARADQAWQTYLKSPAYQADQLKNSFQQLEIEVGKGLLPAFKTLVQVLKPITAVGSTRFGSDVVSGLLLGLTGKKLLSMIGKGGGSGLTKVLGIGGKGAATEAATGAAGTAEAAGLGIGAGATFTGAGVAAGAAASLYALGWGLASGINPNLIGTGAAKAGSFGLPLNGLHIPSHISAGIPGYARGGVTSGPMAIVGEGSKMWPEYVVPTDPTYRARALGLFESLGGHLLGPGVPQMLIAMGVSKSKSKSLGASTGIGGGSNVALGQRMAAALGWSGQEWGALQALWQRESGWSNTARNPSSGAYGIPQALPPTKMPYAAQAAGGSQAAAQIMWGLQYIRGRYTDPLGAWAHEQNFGWYAKGGVLPFASYDSGGYLPEGISLAHNGTGAPEPVGHDLGAGVHIEGGVHFHGIANGKQAADAFIKELRQQAARR